MLKISNLVKEFDKELIPIDHLDLEVNKGDVLSLIGPSGTGKSTLLRMINLLETPTSGEIYFKGKNILDKKTNKYEVRQHIGMVFQNYTLFSTKTVLENVMCGPLDILKMDKKEAEELAFNLLCKVGMLSHKDHFPHELSGGQRQRVAIARALAMKPEILLLDEPTSALDPTMVSEVEDVIESLAKSGLTMIIVSHDLNFVKKISNRVVFLSKGIIIEDGTPDQIFNHPQKMETVTFIESFQSIKFDIFDENFSIYEAALNILEFREDFASIELRSAMISVFKECVKEIKKKPTITSCICAIGFSNKENTYNIGFMYNGEFYNFIEQSNNNELKNLISIHTSDVRHREYDEMNCTNIIRITF